MPATAVDDTIRGCLERLRKGEWFAAGILADYLDEISHPLRRRVRRLWTTWQSRERFWVDHDFGRSKRTRWEALASDRAYYRRKIAKLFGRIWKPLPVRKLV